MNETLLIIGIVLVAAAIVGGGVKLAGNEIPVINTFQRQALLAVVGIGVLVFVWLSRPNFRVASVAVTADQAAVTLCPGFVTYTATIEATGGSGSVGYRFVHNGQPGDVDSVEFSASGTLAAQESFEVGTLPGLPALGPDRVYVEVLSPNAATSSEASVPCSLLVTDPTGERDRFSLLA